MCRVYLIDEDDAVIVKLLNDHVTNGGLPGGSTTRNSCINCSHSKIQIQMQIEIEERKKQTNDEGLFGKGIRA